MSLPVKPQTFYVRDMVDQMIPVINEFPDLPLSGGSDANNLLYKEYNIFTGGETNISQFISGNTYSDINYGTYALTGGYMRTFVTGADLSTPDALSLTMFKTKQNLPLTKGKFTLAQVNQTGSTIGHKIGAYATGFGSDNISRSENFDDKEGRYTNQIQVGNMFFQGPYLLWSDIEACGIGVFWDGKRDHSFTQFKKDAKANKRWSADANAMIVPLVAGQLDVWWDGNDGSVTAYRIAKKTGENDAVAIDDGYIDFSWGKWGTGKTGWSGQHNYLRSNAGELYRASGVEKELVSKIQFATITPKPESPMQTQELDLGLITDYWCTRSIQNPFSSDENNALILSTIEITNEGKGVNGNALRVNHQWDFQETYRLIEQSYIGGDSSINPQVAMLGLYNIPLPLTWDVGEIHADAKADKRTFLPHIGIDMSIVKLGPTPLLGVNAEGDYTGNTFYTGSNIVQTGSWTETSPADTITFTSNHGLEDGNKIKATFPGGATSDGFYFVVNKADTTIQLSTTSGGAVYEGGADDAATLVTGNFGTAAPDKDAFTLYTEGTRTATISDYFASGGATAKLNSKNQAESLLRSVAIVFSNRKPLSEHNTLDKYLDFCMTQWYGDGLNGQAGDPDAPTLNEVGLVGGVLFRCYGMQNGSDATPDSVEFLPPDYDSQKVYAQALPVVNNTDIARFGLTTSSGTAFKAYASGGLCGFTPNTKIGNNMEQRQAGNGGKMITLATCPTYNVYNDWTEVNSTHEPLYFGPKQVELPMNTFFNMKFYIDMLSKQSTYTNSYNPYYNFPYTGMKYTADTNVLTEYIEFANHGLIDGTKVSFDGITNTTGIADNTAYYVVDSDYPGINAAFKVALTSGGAAIDLGGSNDTGIIVHGAWPYGSSTDTLSDIESGSPMRVVFDTGKPWLPPNGTIEDDMTKNLQFLDIPFTSTKDASETFADQQNTAPYTCRYPKYMTIWVQNYRWVRGAQNDDRVGPKLANSDTFFYYGDVGASGSSMEVDVLIDNIKMVNFEPSTSNFNASKPGLGGWGLTNNGTTSLMSTMNTGTYYGTSMGGAEQGVADWWNTMANYGPTAAFNERQPAAYLTLGLDSKDDFATVGGSSNNHGYLLFNDFWTSNYTDINRVNAPDYLLGVSGAVLSVSTALSGATQWGGTTKLGGQFCGGARATSGWGGTTINTEVEYDTPIDEGPSVYQVIDSYTDATTTAPSTQTTADNSLCITSGANTTMSCDAFTQKGFAYWNVSGVAHDPVIESPRATYATWGRRENVLTSTKIVSIPASNEDLDDFQIEVTNPDIFNGNNPEERYIIYKAYKNNGNTTGSQIFQKTNLKLAGDMPLAGSVATFTTSGNFAFNLADDEATPLLTEANLAELYISPWKYWMTVMFGEFTETDVAKIDTYIGRNYGQIAMVNETPDDSDSSQLGTTWNESLYTYLEGATPEGEAGRSAIYAKNWDISTDADTSILELMTDYGHGAQDEETGAGGYVAHQTATSGNYLDLDMGGMVDAGMSEDEEFTLFTKLDGTMSDKTIKITSEESSAADYYKPRIYWKYYDALPTTPFVSVAPVVDLLDKDTNLYDITTDNLNAVRFTWDEGDDDLWYKYFIVGTGSINNKYEGARIWIPLNEEPTSQDLSTFNSFSAYNETSSETTATSISLTNGGAVTSDLNGLAGWAPQFNGATNEYIKLSSGTTGWDFPFTSSVTPEFSLVAHFTPTSGTADDKLYVLAKGAETTGLSLSVQGADSNTPVIKLIHSGTTLESPPIVLDGSPLNVIYTYLSGNKTGPDASLYVNGALVDNSSSMGDLPTADADLYIGCSGASTTEPFKGTIEEIIFYNTALVVAEKPGELIYNTSNLADVDATMTTSLNHNTKLFLFDYHNIRGKSRRNVTSSNQISWRASRV